MFVMHMPWTFRVGDRADVRINKQPAQLWWRDSDTLVINDIDVRRICVRRPVAENLQVFYCADADGSEYEVSVENRDGFVVKPKSHGGDL